MGFIIFVGASVVLLGFLLSFIIQQKRDVYSQALSLAAIGKYIDARALVRDKLEEDYSEPYGHFVMAKIYSMEGDPMNEAKHLETIKKNNRYTKEIDPVTVCNRVADIYYSRDYFEESFFHYLDTLSHDPSNVVACFRLGFMALGQKELKIADQFLSRLPADKISNPSFLIARGVISGVLGQGKERECFETAFKQEKSSVSGFLYALALSRENKHKEAIATANALVEEIEDEYIRFTIFQFLMCENILMQSFTDALKFARLCMEIAIMNGWQMETLESETHFSMISIFMGKYDEASEPLIHVESEKTDNYETILLANLKYKLERNLGSLDSLSGEFDLPRELNLLSATLFPNTRYFELSGLKSSKPLNVRGLVDETGKKIGNRLESLALDKFEKFYQLTGTQFKNQATRIALALGFRVTREIQSNESDGVNFLCSLKSDVEKRAILKIRKWKDARVSDVFLRDLLQQKIDFGCSIAMIVGDFILTEAGRKLLEHNDSDVELINGEKFAEILEKTM